MDKQTADRLITEYMPKLYGFAVKNSFLYDEAEELCGEITCQVYLALLRAEEIANIDGYIWRISRNTYAKYVSSHKKRAGVSIDGMEIPYEEDFLPEDPEEEQMRLRREVAFLSQTRREIVYLFYYRNKSIRWIASHKGIPEGTVKWHLNKARNELKEGFIMERKIGKLGMAPVEAKSFGHNGSPAKEPPEHFLGDRINLNIVYSVYHTPRNGEEIAEELGMTPVFIEDRITLLEENGFLVKKPGGRYTTYVSFSPETFSAEAGDKKRQLQMEAAQILADEYVPRVLESIRDVQDVYIPGGNRELLEAAAVMYAVANKCGISCINRDLSRYRICTAGGADYMAYVYLPQEQTDPEYHPIIDPNAYNTCGNMYRWSEKYPGVYAWSIDSRYCSRTGYWVNNKDEDYEYLYEFITGAIEEDAVNAEKFRRLRERKYLTEENEVGIMIIKGNADEFFGNIPCPDEHIRDRFAQVALDLAMAEAKQYPEQMQDLVVAENVSGFISNVVALMVKDILYRIGTWKPLTDREKVTSDLLMFCDKLPAAK